MADCREFTCAICGKTVYVCRRCDRGQRYCSPECARKARHASIRRAAERYRRTAQWRAGNARRQRAFYLRQLQRQKNLTHHSSHRGFPFVTIVAPRVAAASSLQINLLDDSQAHAQRGPRFTTVPRCQFCGCPCGCTAPHRHHERRIE